MSLGPEVNKYVDKLVRLLENKSIDQQLAAFEHELTRLGDNDNPEKLQQQLSIFEQVAERLGIDDEYGEWFVRKFMNSDDFGSGVDGVILRKCPCANCDEEEAHGCDKEGTFRCSICGLVKYCGATCQRAHWPVHKKICKESVLAAKGWQPAWIAQTRTAAWMGPEDISLLPKAAEGRWLWGTLPAYDVLNWSSNKQAEEELVKTPACRLCFPASGDLRNIIKTINGLPSGFSRPLEIHINDREPFVVARNWLTLMLLFCKGPEAIDIVIALWYSFSMTLQQQNAIQLLLLDEDLAEEVASADKLKSKWETGKSTLQTHFITSNGDIEPWVYLSGMVVNEVTSEEATKTRDNILKNPKRIDYFHKLLWHLKPYHREAVNRFRDTGMLLPFGSLLAQHTAPNRFILHPAFGWMIPDSADPLQGWPLQEVLAFAESAKLPNNDLYGALFFYLRDQLSQAHQKLQEHEIQIHLYCEDATDLVQRFYFPSGGKRPNFFDRIDASTLSDSTGLGVKKTLENFAPLLNPFNSLSTLITLFEKWTDADKCKNQLADVAEKEIQRRSGEAKVDPRQAFDEMMQDGRMSPIVKLYDHFDLFVEYLKKEGAIEGALACGVKRRETHRVVPPRLFVPLTADQHATPKPASDEEEYIMLSLSTNSLFERFAEWYRVSPKDM